MIAVQGQPGEKVHKTQFQPHVNCWVQCHTSVISATGRSTNGRITVQAGLAIKQTISKMTNTKRTSRVPGKCESLCSTSSTTKKKKKNSKLKVEEK
jgi:hypothetical protein